MDASSYPCATILAPIAPRSAFVAETLHARDSSCAGRILTDVGAAVSVALTEDERSLLMAGLSELGGPGRPNDDVARTIGFQDVTTMFDNFDRLLRLLQRGAPMTSTEWAQVLIATEISFASDYYGAGLDWEAATDDDDEITIARLRAVQRKLAPVAKL